MTTEALTTDPPPRRILVDGVWLYQHVCAAPGCGVLFTSRRADARTHSGRCRKAASRARRNAQPTPQKESA